MQATGNLLNLLQTEGVISAELSLAMERYMDRWQRSAFHALLECRIFSESDLMTHLAEILGLSAMTPGTLLLDQAELLPSLSYWDAKDLCAMHVRFRKDQREVLLLADPSENHVAAIQSRFTMGDGVPPLLLCEPSRLQHWIEAIYPLEHQISFPDGLSQKES
jgi:hypothetical protein